jgi:TolA-binding protein
VNDDDLSVRARRGELDDASEKRLTLLLASSREALLSHRAGLEFDAEDSLLPGDAELARRITDRVLATKPNAVPPRRSWLNPALGVAVLVGLAALIPLWKGKPGERPTAMASALPSRSPTVPTSALSPADADEHRAVPDVGVEPASAVTTSVKASSRAGAGPRPTSASRPRSRPDATAANESASTLFARANRARREADAATAEALYQVLQERYPASSEALAADMALGLLALNANRAELALKHFGSYLTRAPQGPLAPDALWSRARALSLLGRSAAADESLRELLKRYPESAYAGAARAKLPRTP